MSATDVMAARDRIERLSVDLDIGPGVPGAGDADALALRVRRELTPAVEEAMAAFADRALRLETLEVDLGSHVGPIDWPALRGALVEALTAALRARLPDAAADGGYRAAAARDAPAPSAWDGVVEAAPDRNPAPAEAGKAGPPRPPPDTAAATARLSATLAAAEAMVGVRAAGAAARGDASVALSAAALRARLQTLADALSAHERDRARRGGAPPPETPPMTPDAQAALTALLRIASGADGHDAAAGAARARLARWRAAAATAGDPLAVLRAALAE